MESHLASSMSPHSSSSSETNILEHIFTTTLQQAAIKGNTNNLKVTSTSPHLHTAYHTSGLIVSITLISSTMCLFCRIEIVPPTDNPSPVSKQTRRTKQISSESNTINQIRRHPSSPHPQYRRAPSKHQKRIVNTQFNNQSLKPVITPKPTVFDTEDGIYDDESDQDNEHPYDINRDDIYAADRYRTIKQHQFEKRRSSDEYHGYQVEEKHDNQSISKTPFEMDELCGKYCFVRMLGRGAFGVVAEGIHVSSGKQVAIKRIRKVFDQLYDAKRLLRELRICRLLSGHTSIVELIDIVPPNKQSAFHSLILVFEFCDSDLFQIIHSNQFLSESHVQYIMYQILLGVEYMHSLNIYHRDLKPANILINQDCTIQICDFGLSRSTKYNNSAKMFHTKHTAMFKHNIHQKVKHKPLKLTQHVQTRWYRAPEVILLEQTADNLAAVDIWSVGCIFGELLQMLKENVKNHEHRKPMFPGDSSLLSPVIGSYCASTAQLAVIFDVIGTPTPEELLSINNPNAVRYLERKFQKRAPSKLERRFKGTHERESQWNRTHQNKKNCFGLLRGCLQFDVEKRVTAKEALLHPYVDEVRDQEKEMRLERLLNQINQDNGIKFEFEDVALSMDQYRQLIMEEILMYQ
eukprot:77224_1